MGSSGCEWQEESPVQEPRLRAQDTFYSTLNNNTMNILRLALLLLNILLSARADQLDTLEDNIVIEDFDQFSGSGDEVCDDGSGSGEESEAYSVESAEYSMTTSGTVGLDIDISLQRMSDSSVQMVCKMKRTELLKEVEGSGAAADTSDVFPASIYLIRDIAVCADLATAVGNDITTSALKLVDVSGPGEDVERLEVSWDLIRQTHCMAVLRESGEGSGDEAVVVEARLSLPGPRCVRREKMLVSSPSTRTFTSINLASFALISLGVTGQPPLTHLIPYHSLSLGAFTVAAASPAVQNFINNNNNNNNNLGAEQAVASFFLTVTPAALLLGYYYVFTRRASLKRKFDNFSRSKIVKGCLSL